MSQPPASTQTPRSWPWSLLRARAAAGAAVVVTLHDLTLAARHCDRLAVLSGGRLVALGPPAEALSAAVLAEVFALEGALVETPAGVGAGGAAGAVERPPPDPPIPAKAGTQGPQPRSLCRDAVGRAPRTRENVE